jgi:hypothetical protein
VSRDIGGPGATAGSGSGAGPGIPGSPESASGSERAEGGSERAELERLRAEVRELRARQEGAGQEGRAPAPARRGRWRAPLASVLIALGCAVAPVAVLGVWAAGQVSDTDRYVANMAPLISEPPIQHALSARITAEIEKRLDPRVEAATAQAAAELRSASLPRLSGLLTTFSGQISSGVNSAVAAGVSRFAASPAMAALWTQSLRVTHQGVVRVLSGQGGGAVEVVNNEVVLHLGPVIAQVKDYLVAHGLAAAANIPVFDATFPLFEAPNLARAQQGYRLITTLRWVLPFLALALMALGIYAARGRRRALAGAALGLSASMLVLGIALTAARGIYLNSLPKSVSSDAAAALYDTLVRFIRQGLRVLLVAGLVIAAAAFFAGPSAAAVRSRNTAKSGIGALRARIDRSGVRAGPVGEWTAGRKPLLRVTAAAAAALTFIFWGQPTVAVVIWLAVLLLVALALIELIGGRAGGPEPAARR